MRPKEFTTLTVQIKITKFSVVTNFALEKANYGVYVNLGF